jgi:hypothetical protein
MPIRLENTSNIRVTYNTGSNYIIETVKSDIYVRGTTSGNLSYVPTVSPTLTTNIATFTHSGGTENQTPHTIFFPESTVCDILVVGGGGGGGNFGGGGGGGDVIYQQNISFPSGTYNIIVGAGGISQTISGKSGYNGNNSSISSISAPGFSTITAAGGGGGGGWTEAPPSVPSIGTSSGGGGGGTGNGYTTGATSQYSGAGGNGRMDGGLITSQGGGGGSVGAGLTATIKSKAGNGGNGNDISITGVSQQYGGGGGGLNWAGEFSYTFPNIGGGTGVYGGGNGPYTNNGTAVPGTSGTPNTGGGGGGNGYSGGSGIVIIKVISPTTNKYLFFNYLPAQPTLNYTLTFPTRTIANFNNSGDKVLNGQYTVSVRTTQSTITPTQGQNLQDRLYFTSNLAIRYHTLNPIKTTEGAQWTYSSSNANVYHLGSVGIGTTSPEYSLDVRGFIYSSSGGYTSSALTKWSVLSDRRIKENIVKASYDKCLENVKNIELYNFNFKDNYVNTNDRHQLGFIAQEVQQIYPKAVEVSRMIMNLEEKIDDLLTLNTTQIDYTLYGSVKCLIQKLENIKIKMEQIKTVYNITT